MPFPVTCANRAGALQVRSDKRHAHLDWAGAADSPVKMAGPLIGPNQDPAGPQLVVDAEDEADLREVLKEDPYLKAGLA